MRTRPVSPSSILSRDRTGSPATGSRRGGGRWPCSYSRRRTVESLAGSAHLGPRARPEDGRAWRRGGGPETHAHEDPLAPEPFRIEVTDPRRIAGHRVEDDGSATHAIEDALEERDRAVHLPGDDRADVSRADPPPRHDEAAQAAAFIVEDEGRSRKGAAPGIEDRSSPRAEPRGIEVRRAREVGRRHGPRPRQSPTALAGTRGRPGPDPALEDRLRLEPLAAVEALSHRGRIELHRGKMGEALDRAAEESAADAESPQVVPDEQHPDPPEGPGMVDGRHRAGGIALVEGEEAPLGAEREEVSPVLLGLVPAGLVLEPHPEGDVIGPERPQGQ